MVLVRKERLKVSEIDLPLDMTISHVNDPTILERIQSGKFLIETPTDLYLVDPKGNVAFHYSKPGPAKTLKVQKLEVSPDNVAVKAEITEETIIQIAKRMNLMLFETSDGFYLPSSDMVFFARKDEKEKRKT